MSTSETKKESDSPSESRKIERPTFKQFISGDIQKQWFLKRYFPVFGVTFALCLFIAYLLFDGEQEFTIFVETISGLGDYIESPGWAFFSIAMIFAGFTFLSVTGYIYRHMKNICRGSSMFITFFLLIGVFGIFFISVVADANIENFIGDWSMSKVHTRVAMFTFASMGVGIVFYGFVFLKDVSIRLGGTRQINWIKNLIPYAFFLYGALYLGIASLIKEINNWGYSDGPPWLNFPFCEWQLLFVLFIYFASTIWVLPEKMINVSKKWGK
jgi:hypothetical protein